MTPLPPLRWAREVGLVGEPVGERAGVRIAAGGAP